MYRIGFGFDVHKFSRRRRDLILGAVKIPFSVGLSAVSDGDVVLHSICDALCGAALLGDIGDYFPPEAKKSKGISSQKIVQAILNKIDKKFKIVNMDVTIIADKPKLKPYKAKILESLKKIFLANSINVKIKSKEGLDILGKKNSIACISVALLKNAKNI